MERINATTGSYNFIDLFAGAGGLSEGFIQAGFSPVAHVEMNPYAAQTLETRTGYYYLKAQGKLDIYKDYISGKITRDEFLQHIPEEQLQSVFCETMSNETLPRLFENIDRILTQRGIKQVDVIIGGPPCQAYSLVGRAQSKHMETPMSADPRNDLYKLYARFLQKYHPKMFVFENVMGIKSANSGATWLKVQEALRSVGYEIECHEQNSKNFGVLQNRRRMIIVGWLKNTGLSYPQFEQTIADATVNDILSDLPALQPGGKSGEYRSDDFSDYLRITGIRKDSDILTHHCARPNKDRDIEIYRRTIELWNDGHKRLNRYNADAPIWLSEKIGAQKIKSYTDQEILESLSHVRGPLACATYTQMLKLACDVFSKDYFSEHYRALEDADYTAISREDYLKELERLDIEVGKKNNLGEIKSFVLLQVLSVMLGEQIYVFCSDDRNARNGATNFEDVRCISLVSVFSRLKEEANWTFEDAEPYIESLIAFYQDHHQTTFRVMEASEVRRLQRIPCRQVLQEIFNGKFIELKNGMLRYKR